MDYIELNIKELRNGMKLSQQELSDILGIPKGRINAWEQNKGKPKMNDYIKLKNFFDSKGEQSYSKDELPLDKINIPLDKNIIHEPQTNYQSNFIPGSTIKGVVRDTLELKIELLEQRLRDKDDQIKDLRYTITMQKETIEALKDQFSRKNDSSPTNITV